MDTKPTPRPSAPKAASPYVSREHRRGDVWLVRSDPKNPAVGTELWSDRPAVVISADVLNRRSGFAQVVYLTTSAKKRSSPVNVPMGPFTTGERAGDAMALCGQVHTVDASRLVRRLGAYTDRQLLPLESAVAVSLSLSKQGAGSGAAFYSKWERQMEESGIDLKKEIDALASQVVDDRVVALQKAVNLLMVQRDSLRLLQEADASEQDVADELARALSAGRAASEEEA